MKLGKCLGFFTNNNNPNNKGGSSHLSMKEGCFFVLFVTLRSLKIRCLCHTLCTLGKCSMSNGAPIRFHNVSTYS